ncbi:hypothetical protein POPTR_004G110976v4 [Populus trichocarpa]|uniref:Uncharacterized protein n=1 Tax=Populus trichocarpa TaxID=3694 RepID=A0ACC0T4G2_POPTR|nr:hypothetical protein BDE02_04G098200 [Populus trichocarpa]KAI9396332.1 hypothetical protein POPTR_004G110976v4 [Populus trichocarpa]
MLTGPVRSHKAVSFLPTSNRNSQSSSIINSLSSFPGNLLHLRNDSKKPSPSSSFPETVSIFQASLF